ncbi:MAG: hypothetical protein PHE21_03370, partial [Candidatus Dojkabacteria bacterium]|nr:hypothetical protein [Candidatus Dojkabacteria bacterium]
DCLGPFPYEYEEMICSEFTCEHMENVFEREEEYMVSPKLYLTLSGVEASVLNDHKEQFEDTILVNNVFGKIYCKNNESGDINQAFIEIDKGCPDGTTAVKITEALKKNVDNVCYSPTADLFNLSYTFHLKDSEEGITAGHLTGEHLCFDAEDPVIDAFKYSGDKIEFKESYIAEVGGKEKICCSDGQYYDTIPDLYVEGNLIPELSVPDTLDDLGEDIKEVLNLVNAPIRTAIDFNVRMCPNGFDIEPTSHCDSSNSNNVQDIKPDNIVKKDTDMVSKVYASDVLGTTDTNDMTQYKIHLDNTGFWEIGGTDTYVESEEDMYVYIDINGDGQYNPLIEPLVPSTMVSVGKNKSDYTIKLEQGINIISINFFGDVANSDSFTAIDLVKLLNRELPYVKRITQFSGGKWEGGIQINQKSGEITGNDFPIVPGRGYLIMANLDGEVKIPGYKLQSSMPVAFSSGWNLVGINGYTKAYTAKSLIESINGIEGLTADNVSWWPTSKGRYEGVQVSDGKTYGLDFAISPINGYFIRIKEYSPSDSDCKSLVWHEGGQLNGVCGNSK